MKKIITSTLLFLFSILANGLFAQELSAGQLNIFQSDNLENFQKTFNENDFTKCFQVKGKSYTLLSLSVKNDKKNIFNYLASKTDVNQACNGVTPLMQAASTGNMNAAKGLLKFGANKDLKDSKGKTAKNYAAENKQTAIAMIL
ncbi:Ankyrin repeat-containing protein [Chryseobacterium arachidis]|uniref:Ankyrin repeat-containing protein n=1 Tax=Chryseobacterium arachidis TaxID=1416778 RepID=A0A1M5ADX3_9FLAO|nr:ankyrin repeat domain-containing protein [Chryseobacterium arachidis]SHF28433.1 Ankyrin repeat-containing protein [Chryseobacterium arachidis]